MAQVLILSIVMSMIALTVWNNIISPVYDAATTFLLVGENGERKTISVGGKSPDDIAALLAQKQVTAVICGAISQFPAQTLSRNNITVLPWIRGNIEEVLLAYQNNALDTPQFLMPGCGCGTRRGSGAGRRCRRRGNQSGGSS